MRFALGKALPWLAVGLLIASVPAFRVIPFGPFWGWDLENLFVFHRCTAPAAASHWLARNAPYLVSGHACADSADRAMYYPPLLYWSFTWLRLLPLFAAVRLWAVVILLGVGSLPFFWLPAGERLPTRAWRLYLLWLLMLAQFPVIFSIERANVDLVPLLMWSLSFLLFRTGRDVFAGALAGLAAASKLYPAISCAVVGFGLVGSALLARAVGLKRAASFCAGMLATVLAGTAFFPQSQDYFLRVLPAFASTFPAPAIWAHSLRALAGESGWMATTTSAILFAIWAVAAVRRIAREPGLVFAGALAISTYFAATSHDYNLITAYPLLLLQMARAHRRETDAGEWTLLLLGLLAVVGNRAWFNDPSLYGVHVFLQVLWLALTGLRLLRDPAVERSSLPSEPDDRHEIRDQPISL